MIHLSTSDNTPQLAASDDPHPGSPKTPVTQPGYHEAVGREQPTVSNNATPLPTPRGGRRQLSSWAGFGLIALGTTLAALLEISASGTLGWLTGSIFTVLSALTALTLRSQDLITAVISPPLAYLFAVIVSAQMAVVGSSGNFWLLQATTILSGLAFNAQWVFLGTVAALVIMIVRRVSERHHTPVHAPALPAEPDQPL